MTTADIQELIARELHFFKGISQSQQPVSKADKDRFRLETVAERRVRLSNELFITLRGQVQAGPFKGLKLDSNPSWGTADQASKLLGIYEQEVMNEVFKTSSLAKRHFIDLGAADGYYAIGGLLKNRFELADCFEIDPLSQKCIQKNSEINNVMEFVKVHGEATEEFFKEVHCHSGWKNVFILCDVEGAEFDIFTATTLEAIKGATILIEIHNWIEDFWPKYEGLLHRAASNYKISTLSRVSMQIPDIHELRSWHDDNRALILSEGRPNVMRYLKLEAK